MILKMMSVSGYFGQDIEMRFSCFNTKGAIILVALCACFMAITGCSSNNNTAVDDGKHDHSFDSLTSENTSVPIANTKIRSCIEELVLEKANILARICLELSPATHPPCNAENSCSIIRAEIKRSCDYIMKFSPTMQDKRCDLIENL